MLHLIVFLLLATVLKQSLGETGVVSDVPERLQKEIIDKHNEFRRAVKPTARNMLKVQWDEKASKVAQAYARKCPGRVSHKAERTVDHTECGQNIRQANYLGSWADTIELWHSTVSDFKYGSRAMNRKKDIYSYTQIVWYRSYLVGCALAFCPHKPFPYVYVCNYCPSGNHVETVAKPYKEGPSCADCPSHCEDKLCSHCGHFILHPISHPMPMGTEPGIKRRRECHRLSRRLRKLRIRHRYRLFLIIFMHTPTPGAVGGCAPRSVFHQAARCMRAKFRADRSRRASRARRTLCFAPLLAPTLRGAPNPDSHSVGSVTARPGNPGNYADFGRFQPSSCGDPCIPPPQEH